LVIAGELAKKVARVVVNGGGVVRAGLSGASMQG
jgi:hypothetical protein